MSKLLPQRITTMREHRGLSQSDLAEISGVGQAYISKLERDIAPNVAGIILGKLATALETSVDYLLGLSDNPAPKSPANHPALRDPGFAELADAWPDLDSEERNALVIFTRLFLKERFRGGRE